MEDKKFTGLLENEVLKSREKYGSNVIVEKEPDTFWDRIKDGFGDPMIKLLCAIAVIMGIMCVFGQANWYEPVGTVVAILIVTIISAKTGMASDDEYRKLKNSTKAEPVKVRRNGIVTVVDIEDLVVGDIVILQAGDKIPADGVLVQGELRVDNSALNGEAEECKKFAATEDFHVPDEITGETFVDKHSLFRGATVYNGEGLLHIEKVGMATMMGKMAEDMKDDEVESPLQVKLGKLAKQISTFGYVGAIVIAIAYFIHFVILAGGVAPYFATGWINIVKDLLEAVSLAIVIVVCAVPEGLPLMIALVLMANSSKMLQHNVLVRKAIGIETAGSLNILFSDKTGTITKGKLEVVEFFEGDGEQVPLDQLSKRSVIKGYIDLAIGKNTTAMFDEKHRVIGGNATDQALMNFIGEDTYNKLANDKDCVVTANQIFNSANKFSQAYIESAGKTFYKGAPEKLLAKAKKFIDNDGVVKDINIDVVNETINKLAEKAMRVLAFGYSERSMTEDNINDDVVIIGFVGIRDDVRPEAVEAIKEVQAAGIQVVMITGDRKETAVAIAKDAGLLGRDAQILTMMNKDEMLEKYKDTTTSTSTDGIAVTSDILGQLTDDEVKVLISGIRVIARALPTDKSRMVRLCQEMNLVTGMTGDGVNDSPALKRADVGFAMGSGTAVAKEAGDIVIIDDNFKSIKDAILYGRTIYHNILKFCKFQLSINVGAVLVSAVLPFIGIEEPLTVIHLLFVNLCMDSLGSLMLGNEPALEKYMHEPPRKRDESIVSKNMFIQFVCMGVYMLVLGIVWFSGIINNFFPAEVQNTASSFVTPDMAKLKTGFFAAFMISAILNGWNVRSEGFDIFKGIKENTNFIKVMGAMIIATVFLCVVGGPIGNIFSCTRFGIAGWIPVLIAGVLIIPVDMLRKLIFGTYKV